MRFAFLIALLCILHSSMANSILDEDPNKTTADKWMESFEKVRLLDARKTAKYNESSKRIPFHPDDDYFMREVSWPEVDMLRNVERTELTDDLGSNIKLLTEKMMVYMWVFLKKDNVTFNGTIPGVFDDTFSYQYYNLRTSCGPKVTVRKQVHEHLADESNQVNIWIINEMSNKIDVIMQVDNEESTTDTTIKGKDSSTNVGGKFTIKALGQKGSVSASVETKTQDFFTNTTSTKKNRSFKNSFTVPHNSAVKYMRQMIVRTTKHHYMTSCRLYGYIGLGLDHPLNVDHFERPKPFEQHIWFMPVTELAKVYESFVVDDSTSGLYPSVIFNFPGFEVKTESFHKKKALGFGISELDAKFLALPETS